MAQFARASKPRESLDLARQFIVGKIKNSRTLIRRHLRDEARESLQQLSDLLEKAKAATNAMSLLGIEGMAAKAHFAAFAGGDPVAIADHVSDDFVNDHTAALGEGCVGRDEYLDRLPGFLSDMHDLSYEIDDLVVDGERAMVTYTLRARWQGTTPVVVRGAQRLVVRDGRIASRTDYWDSADFLRQADPEAAAALARFGIT